MLRSAAGALTPQEARDILSDVSTWCRDVLQRPPMTRDVTTARIWLLQQAKPARPMLPVLAKKRPPTTPSTACARCDHQRPMVWTGTGWAVDLCDGEGCGWVQVKIEVPPPPTPLQALEAVEELRREAWAFSRVDPVLLERNTVLVGAYTRWAEVLQEIADHGDPVSSQSARDALRLSAADSPALLPAPAPDWEGPADRPALLPAWMVTTESELRAELNAQNAESGIASEGELRRRYDAKI